MTDQPDDGADENDGKYSSDEEMTFENLLKMSLRKTESQSNGASREPTTQTSSTEQVSETAQNARRLEREESASERLTAVAEQIAQAHTTGTTRELASGQTSAVGQHTTYEFNTSTIENDTYYYLAQTTDRSYERHLAKLAIKDFGTEWDVDPPDVCPDAIQRAIKNQRYQDHKAGRKPVSYLSDAQRTEVATWYQSRVDFGFDTLEYTPRKYEDTVHVIDEYLVLDLSEEELLLGKDLTGLTSQQATVIIENLLTIIRPDIDLTPALADDIHQRFKYPLLGKLSVGD